MRELSEVEPLAPLGQSLSFSDGNAETLTPSHTWATYGTCTVTLTVTVTVEHTYTVKPTVSGHRFLWKNEVETQEPSAGPLLFLRRRN